MSASRIPHREERLNTAQGRVPAPITISSGMLSSLPFQNLFRLAKISDLAWAIFSGVSCSMSGRNGAATSLNCSQYSSTDNGQRPATMRSSSWTLLNPAASNARAADRVRRT